MVRLDQETPTGERQHLDSFGVDGWELVSVTTPSDTHDAMAYLKRAINEAP